MAGMIRDDQKIAIGRNVAAPDDPRFQPSVESGALSVLRTADSPSRLQRRWQIERVGLREAAHRTAARTPFCRSLAGCRSSTVRRFASSSGAEIASRAFTAIMLAEFRQRQRIESQILDQPRCRGDVARARWRLARAFRRATVSTSDWCYGVVRALVSVDHPPQHRGDLGALDLARARARQFGVGEAQDADALVRIESRATLSKCAPQLILDRAAALAACIRGHHQRRDLFALGDLQADDREFLADMRMAVSFLKLVDVDIVAARIDDDVLGAAHDVQAALIVETAEVAGMQPSVLQHVVGGGLIAIVTRHHVGPVAPTISADRSASVGHASFDLDADQRLADRTRLQRFVGTRDAQHRRRLQSARSLRAAGSRCR